MKHKVTVIISIAVILGLGILSWNVYSNDTLRAKIAQDKVNIEKSINAELQARTIANEKARIKTECDKETSYYNSLTTKQKATVEAPNCELGIVE